MTDWSVVGGDPAPGDPGSIQLFAREVAHTADLAHQCRMELESVGASCSSMRFEGETARQFNTAFSVLTPRLSLVSEAYYGVAGVLRDYSRRLEATRREAMQATERAWLAQRRRAEASSARDAAASRVRSLQQSLSGAKASERSLYSRYTAESAAHAPSAPSTFGQYRSAVSRRTSLEAQQGQAENERRAYERLANQEQDRLDRERRLVNDLREQHRSDEKQTADALVAAMPEALRNASFWSKAGDWIGDRAEGIDRFVSELASNAAGVLDALHDGDWLRAVFYAREVLSQIEAIVGVILLALAVVLFFTGIGAPLALLVIAAGVASMKLLASWTLYTTKYTSPKTGKQAVGTGELIMDVAGAALAWLGAGAAANTTAPRYLGRNIWVRLPRNEPGITTAAHVARDAIRHNHGDVIHKVARAAVNADAFHVRDVLAAGKPLYRNARHAPGVMHLVKMVPRDGHLLDAAAAGYKAGSGVAKSIGKAQSLSSEVAELVLTNDGRALDSGGGTVYVGSCEVPSGSPSSKAAALTP
jgi:hypothetical protein